MVSGYSFIQSFSTSKALIYGANTACSSIGSAKVPLGPTLLESVKMRAAILMTLLRERRDELPTLNSRVLVIQAASRPDEEDVAHGVAPA